ncbi:TraI domain-containing protein [Mariprofundus micogutta]|nr:TraI domain-containing protein [Mariprofundus micogutta]
MARNQQAYLRLELENAYESISANCWPNSYRGPDSFTEQDIVEIAGIRRHLDYREIVDIHKANIVPPVGGASLVSIPGSITPIPEDLRQLIMITNSIQTEPLRNFIYDAFSCRDFASRFVSLPASHRYHHAFEGGLLKHSLECVEIVASCPTLSATARELGTIAALFHDAGKTITMQANKKAPIGYMVDHDSLTLAALNHSLSLLDSSWTDAAIALRHIWTCRSQKSWGFKAKMPLVHIVQMADRISSELDSENQAFELVEPWRSHAKHPNSEQRYWRLLPYRNDGAIGGFQRACHD